MLAKVYTLLCHKLFGLLSGVMQWVASMLFWIRHRWIPQIHCCSVACQQNCFSNSIGEGITEECLCRIHFFSLCLILLSFRNSTNFKMITYIYCQFVFVPTGYLLRSLCESWWSTIQQWQVLQLLPSIGATSP